VPHTLQDILTLLTYSIAVEQQFNSYLVLERLCWSFGQVHRL